MTRPSPTAAVSTAIVQLCPSRAFRRPVTGGSLRHGLSAAPLANACADTRERIRFPDSNRLSTQSPVDNSHPLRLSVPLRLQVALGHQPGNVRFLFGCGKCKSEHSREGCRRPIRRRRASVPDATRAEVASALIGI